MVFSFISVGVRRHQFFDFLNIHNVLLDLNFGAHIQDTVFVVVFGIFDGIVGGSFEVEFDVVHGLVHFVEFPGSRE